MVKICKWEVRVNSLWLWWYCILMLVAEGYLMYRAVQKCKEYNELPWRSDQKPVTELYTYICCIVISIMCVPFFVISCIFKVGNYANDGLRLGRDKLKIPPIMADNNDNRNLQKPSKWGTFWKHAGPCCSTFHILAAFALLIPEFILESKKIQFGFSPVATIWDTELDAFFTRPHILPADGAMTNHTLPAFQPSSGERVSTISPEMVNYIVALLIYSLRYPAVFWYTRMSYSFVFSFHLIVNMLYFMFTHCGIGILYKMQVNARLTVGLNLILPPPAVLTLHIVGGTFIYFASIAIFNYGYFHYECAYTDFVNKFRHGHQKRLRQPPSGCQGYVPHCVATVALLVIVACRAPIIYNYVLLYRATGLAVILSCIVWDVAFMLIWIILWFSLTVKQKWHFRILANMPSERRPVVYTIQNDHAFEHMVNNQNYVNCNTVQEDMSHENAAFDHENSPPAVTPDFEIANSDQQINAVHRQTDNDNRLPNGQKVTFEQDHLEGQLVRSNSFGTLEMPKDRVPRARSNSDSLHTKHKERKKEYLRQEREKNKKPKHGVPTPFVNAGHENNPHLAKEALNDLSSVKPHSQKKRKRTTENIPMERSDSTLGKQYRHSLRDKCGKFYQRQDSNPPPAAQSSPRLNQKQHRPHPNVSDSHPPANNPYQIDPRVQPSSRDHLDPRDPRDHRISWHGGPNPSNQPQPNVNNMNPALSLKTNHLLYDNRGPSAGSVPVLNHAPPSGGPSDNIHYQSQPVLSAPERPASRKIPQKAKVPSAASSRQNLAKAGHTSSAVKDLNRDIQIVTNPKPEIGRRDSALPSSNETSSNESTENVLCSQV